MRLKLVAFFEKKEGTDRVERAPFATSSGWEPRKSQVQELVC